MYRLLRSCTVLLILAAAGGCGTSSTSFRSELDAVAPKPQQASLEAHVFGAPSEVRFYVNGKRIKRGLEGSTFKDARLGLQLPPGVYRVEARFRIGEFEGRRLECRVSCLEPLRIRSGESVRLHADMRRDWSHPTEDRFSSFQSRPAGDNGLLEVSGHSTHTIPTAVKYPAHITKEMYAGMRAELLAKSDDPWDGRRSADAITIRGNQVVDDGQDAPAPAANAAPPVAVGGHHVEVGLAVESEPAGAQVAMDGEVLGHTPLRIVLDPRLDHVLQFENEGCETKIQLLGTAEWSQGRGARLVAKLDCQ